MNWKKYYWRNYAYATPIQKISEVLTKILHLSQEKSIRLRYFIVYRKKINLRQPKTFNEKIQYLKLYSEHKELSHLVDKYEVRRFVADRIGEEYLNELINVYNNAEEINYEELPDQFVLKLTHSSGQNIICDDKAKLNYSNTTVKLNRWLKFDYGKFSGEPPYSYVQPRIICEKYLGHSSELFDYKFFCFNGKPHCVQVDMDRTVAHTRNFYDMNWQLMPFRILFPVKKIELSKPDNFEEMISIAERLSADLKFARIDLFNVKGKLYFGEITLFPGNGFEYCLPVDYENKLGDLVIL